MLAHTYVDQERKKGEEERQAKRSWWSFGWYVPVHLHPLISFSFGAVFLYDKTAVVQVFEEWKKFYNIVQSRGWPAYNGSLSPQTSNRSIIV